MSADDVIRRQGLWLMLQGEADSGSGITLEERHPHFELARQLRDTLGDWQAACMVLVQTYLSLARQGRPRSKEDLRERLFETARKLADTWNAKHHDIAEPEVPQPLSPSAGDPGRERGKPEGLDFDALLHRLDDLPASVRQALLLVRCQNLSYEQAALRLGTAPERVCVLIARALEYLASTVPPVPHSRRQ